jgi:hypothetical protein
MNPIDVLNVKKEYLKGIPKYPTRFPSLLVKILIEHFSDKNSTILDPMCGSGIIPAICELYYPDRIVYSGDLNPHSQTVFSELLKFYSEVAESKPPSLDSFINPLDDCDLPVTSITEGSKEKPYGDN